jgi:predicted amidohydrolase
LDEFIVGILQDEFTADPMKNYGVIEKVLLEKHSVADIVVLPEYSMINILESMNPEDVYEKAEVLENSNFLSKISDLAGKIDAYILTHFIEKTDVKPKTRSSSVIVYPSGRIRRVYSKIHLFDAYGYRESEYFISGTEISKALMFGEIKLFVAICYDLRFPELFRSYAFQDAYGVIVHAGWVKGFLKEEILDTLARSRSHENTMYLILADQTGKYFVGRSGVFNPHGYRELDLGYKRNYVEWRIRPEEVIDARREVPVVKQSRSRWNIVLKP